MRRYMMLLDELTREKQKKKWRNNDENERGQEKRAGRCQPFFSCSDAEKGKGSILCVALVAEGPLLDCKVGGRYGFPQRVSCQ
jgi:hypothetical protein